MRFNHLKLHLTALVLAALTSTALAGTTLYVNGMIGSDSNSCPSTTTACKTIGHAIALAASGDSIRVAAAIYPENLTIGISLKLLGSTANTTIIDGGGISTVITISGSGTLVSLSNVTVRNGSSPSGTGGGINNTANLRLNLVRIGGNSAQWGGGIANSGTLTITSSALTGNTSAGRGFVPAKGGAISNSGKLTISKTTLSGNVAKSGAGGAGGALINAGTAIIIDSTLSGNTTSGAGGPLRTQVS